MKSLILFLFCASVMFPQTFRLQRPVANSIPTNGSYLYAEPRYGNNSLGHTGIDIAANYDTIYSASSGKVNFVAFDTTNPDGYEPNGAGNYIMIESEWSGDKLFLYYMHLSKALIAEDANVAAGQPIAVSGNTGNSTGPHLHFEIRQGSSSYYASRNRRNPELWVAIDGMGAIYGKVPNAPNSTRVDISPDPKPRPPYTSYGWSLTYNFNDPGIGSDETYNENYGIGDVKPGTYTITSINGYSRVVTVKAGEVVNADGAIAIGDEGIKPPADFKLYQNYPNPFNSSTIIRVDLPENISAENASLKIYDQLGREVADLSSQLEHSSGQVAFKAPYNLASGIYFYRIQYGGYIEAKSMVYLK